MSINPDLVNNDFIKVGNFPLYEGNLRSMHQGVHSNSLHAQTPITDCTVVSQPIVGLCPIPISIFCFGP